MNLDEITDEWVLANFDINKERKTIENIVSLGQSYYDPCGKVDINEYATGLVKSVEEQTKVWRENPDNAHCKILVEQETVYEWGDIDEHKELGIYALCDRNETDKEVISRIKKKERAKISSKKSAEKRVLMKEEKERKEFERLKAKYE